MAEDQTPQPQPDEEAEIRTAPQEKRRRPPITDAKRHLLGLKASDVDLDELKRMFAFDSRDRRAIDPNMEMVLTQTEADGAGMRLGTDRIRTTPGRYVFNLAVFANPAVRSSVKYHNVPMDKKALKGVEGEMSELLLEQAVTPDDYIEFLNRLHWFCFSITSFTAPSLDLKVLKPIPAIQKRKKELTKDLPDRMTLEEADKVSAVESRLLKESKEILDKADSPGKELYDSGAAGSFNNNYKNTAIMRGMIAESGNPRSRRTSTSNLMDGFDKSESAKYADIMVQASFSRSVGTQTGGYIVNQYNAAFSHVKLGEPGSDCRTKHFLTVKLDKDNASRYHLRYVLGKEGLILLDRKSLDRFTGRTVKMRSPMFCIADQICSKCAGELYYRMGTRNIGGAFSKIGSQLLNRSLKKFHDLTLKTHDMDVLGSFKAIGEQ